jgi:hypothetical protein
MSSKQLAILDPEFDLHTKAAELQQEQAQLGMPELGES